MPKSELPLFLSILRCVHRGTGFGHVHGVEDLFNLFFGKQFAFAGEFDDAASGGVLAAFSGRMTFQFCMRTGIIISLM